MKKLILILVMAFSGCATTPQDPSAAYRTQLSQYTKTNAPKMRAGEMLRSDYYKEVYNIFLESNFRDKGEQMEMSADFIEQSLLLESGNISVQDFENFKRKRIAQHEVQQQENRDNHANTQDHPYIYIPPERVKPPTHTNCTSNKMGNTVQTNCHTN